MTDAPPAAVQAATPAPGSQTSSAGMPAGPSTSPVNSASAASKANQQAAAAGENQGLTNQDQSQSVVPPTQEGVAPEATPAPATLETPRFTPSGNETIDQVTNLLVNKNFEGATDIISEVTGTQELSLASKAKLVDELGADVAGLVINQLESSVAAVKEAGAAEGKRLKDYAFKKFGGSNPEETWSGLQDFAKGQTANLSADDRIAMNEMLSAGGIKAELVIDSLYSKYKESDQYISRPALMQGDKTIQSNTQMLSKVEYQSQIGPAINKYGETSQEVASLRQRRSFSLAQGYN